MATSSIVTRAWKLFRSYKYSLLYVFLLLSHGLLDIASTYFLGQASKTYENTEDTYDGYEHHYIVIYAIICQISNVLNILINQRLVEVESHIMLTNSGIGYSSFASLDYTSQQSLSAITLRSKFNQVGYAYTSIITWGGIQLFQIGSAVCSFFLLVIITESYQLFAMVVAINVIGYVFHTRQLFADFTERRKEKNEFQLEFDDELLRELEEFGEGETPISKMMELEKKNQKVNDKFNDLWSQIMSRLQFINEIPILLIVATAPTITQFFVFNSILTQYNSSAKGLMNFIMQNQRGMDKDDECQKYMAGKTSHSNPPHIELPNLLTIQDVSIPIGKERFLTCASPISFKAGDRVYFKARSGDGKTRLMRALTGKIDGVTLDNNNPANYKNNWMCVNQDKSAHTHTVTTTIRQLFYDESDDELIRQACQIANIDDWLIKTGSLDKPIKKQISGGETCRLALARSVYQLLTDKVGRYKAIVFDEVEQGSDPDKAEILIRNLLKHFPNKIIIVISHLQFIELWVDERGKRIWNMLLTIKDDVVEQYTPDVSPLQKMLHEYENATPTR